jgi:DUF1365 family protein
MFYIDLDELDTIHKSIKLISRNRFNLFNFRDKDHANFPTLKNKTAITTKDKITAFLAQNNIEFKKGRIMLLTNLVTLGYVFNPVSFYFCFDGNNTPVCSVVEVCNTFGEMKLYILDEKLRSGETFQLYTKKYFYVSPFAELDTSFDFILKVPADKLLLRVDDYRNDKRFLLTSLSGKQIELSDGNLLYYFVTFPLITLKIIILIHWQAMFLYFKKLPYIKKKDNQHLQKDIIKL